MYKHSVVSMENYFIAVIATPHRNPIKFLLKKKGYF